MIDGHWLPSADADPRAVALYRRLGTRFEPRDNGCVVWTGHLIKGGYGQTRVDGRMVLLHRLAYEAFVGPIPEGHQVHHECGLPACVNPVHLRAVTARQHMALTPASITAQQTQQTHCKRGHLLEGDNLVSDGKGGRKCRACHRATNLASWHRRKARASGV